MTRSVSPTVAALLIAAALAAAIVVVWLYAGTGRRKAMTPAELAEVRARMDRNPGKFAAPASPAAAGEAKQRPKPGSAAR